MNKRNKEIIKLRKKNNTLHVIALKYGISSERVRQILNTDKFPKYKIRELKKYEEYLKKIKILMRKNLMQEIIRLSKPDRRNKTVIERIVLIKILKDEYRFSFSKIGFLLNKDRTTISHNYKKQYESR